MIFEYVRNLLALVGIVAIICVAGHYVLRWFGRNLPPVL